MYEFRCVGCEAIFEDLRPSGTDHALCACGRIAPRRPARFAVTHPPSGAGLRSRFQLFQEASQEIDHASSKVEADLERPVESPNLWRAARDTAQRMIAAGEAPVVQTP